MNTTLGLAGTGAAAAASARPAELSTTRMVSTRNFNVADFMSVCLSRRSHQPNGCWQSVECADSGIRCYNSPKRLYSPPSNGAGHMSKLLLIDDEADVQYSFQRIFDRSEEHTSELQSLRHLVCRLLLEKNKSCFRSDSW